MSRRDPVARIRRRARRAGVSLSDEVASALGVYYELLYRWNTKINLTSLVDSDAAVDRLVIEPLVAVRRLDVSRGTIVDVGSGGGSPAIPFKLACPRMELVMVESKTRKSAFLREAVRVLGLAEVYVETCRVEELLSKAEMHERADVVTLRAVRAEAKQWGALQAFLRPGGVIAWFRGPVGKERSEMVVPPLEWEATYPLIESLRSRLLVIRKNQVWP